MFFWISSSAVWADSAAARSGAARSSDAVRMTGHLRGAFTLPQRGGARAAVYKRPKRPPRTRRLFVEYVPRPRDTSRVRLPREILDLTELLAENTHENWARERMADHGRDGVVLSAIADLPTPSVLIDLDVLEHNVAAMQADARAAGVKLRPHAKTHKSPEVARLQLSAGAVGLTLAKTSEAEVFARLG